MANRKQMFIFGFTQLFLGGKPEAAATARTRRTLRKMAGNGVTSVTEYFLLKKNTVRQIASILAKFSILDYFFPRNILLHCTLYLSMTFIFNKHR